MKRFELVIPRSALDDLDRRLEQVRWPAEAAGLDRTYGIPAGQLRALVDHWRTGYDWRAHERRINSFPQFTTTIDGQNVHFLHVRSVSPDARPLVMTHGWPSSAMQFLGLVAPLSAAFHLVIPSLPGFPLSGPTTETGWYPKRVARTWAELMDRLGYDRYLAHGADLGAIVTRELARIDPRVAAVHVTQLFGCGVTDETADMADPGERRSVEAGRRYRRELGGYAMLQSTRPQLVAYGAADSPVAQLAWIADAFTEWTDPATPVDRDTLLTTATLYWLTNTAGSAARYYRDNPDEWGTPEPPLRTPMAVARFPHDINAPVRRIAERNHNIVRWTEHERGGHFAAFEVPDLLAADLLAWSRSPVAR